MLVAGARTVMLVLCLVVAGCARTSGQGADPLADASTASSAPLPDPVGPTDCAPVSENRPLGSGTEIHAAEGPDSHVWALVPGTLPLSAGSAVRILWSINGGTRLRLTAVGPDGSLLEPDESYFDAGVLWDRPGSTWASVFTFPEAGCWRIIAERGGKHGDVWLLVA